jgi:hypothetical protein
MYTTNTYRSSKINTADISEYIFSYSNTAPVGSNGAYTAFNDTSNNNIVTYKTPSGSTFQTYNTFAIKIVLLSDVSNIVPMVTDMRCIALT